MHTLAALMLASSLSALPRASYDIVPLPRTVTEVAGEPFVLRDGCTLSFPEELSREARFLQEYVLEETGLRLVQARRGSLSLALDTAMQGDEAYRLEVNEKGISLTAGTPSGIFRGIQTLRKALPLSDGEVELPPVIIEDAPAFAYRGMMLDCGRHFFPVDFIKKYLDILALHQVNVFHWHLTDDQGWRIEIKRYPRLTEVGAWRSGTVVGNNSDVDDETPYGGYYTQEEIREVVRYAAERHITVVPEIDMPGHMMAALAAYPELGCTGGPYEVGHKWGIYTDVLCIGRESTYTFVQNVLDEVMDLFPSPILHIGGDETPVLRWDACEHCRSVGGQAYFTRRVAAYVASKGRRVLGWEEYLTDGLPDGAMVMAWKGLQVGLEAAAEGRDVVMAPLTHCYFDYYQTTPNVYEPSITGMWPIDVEKVWNLDPCPEGAAREHIVGVQANLWTEYIGAGDVVEYMTLPRLAALCEVQWGKAPGQDYDCFKERLTALAQKYAVWDWAYARHLWPETIPRDRWHID